MSVLITDTDRDTIGSVNGLYKLTYQTGIYNINILFYQISTTSRNMITLVLKNVVNPLDNRPLGFTLVQHEVEVGLTQNIWTPRLSYRMTKLNSLSVYSGVRNMTKMRANISPTIDIEAVRTQSVAINDGNECLCKENNLFGSGVCRPCPTGLVTNPTRKACLCKDPKQSWSAAKFSCLFRIYQTRR